MKRKYLTQGDLDGACFLYSIANAVVALSSRKPTVNQWSKALQYIPFSGDFIDGNVGTKNYDERPEVYKFAVEQAISEYSPSCDFVIETYPESHKISDIEKIIDQQSVAIVNIDGEHWVCVVDIDISTNSLMTACSDITNRIFDYSEEECRYGRKYNRVYQLNKNKIRKTSVIRVSLK